METNDRQQRGFCFLLCEDCSNNCKQNCKADIVSDDVMIVAPPIQRMIGIFSEFFGNNTKSVDVRHNARPSHERAFSFIEGRHSAGDGPAHEKMRDWTHSAGASYVPVVSNSIRRITNELGIRVLPLNYSGTWSRR